MFSGMKMEEYIESEIHSIFQQEPVEFCSSNIAVKIKIGGSHG